MKHKILKTLTGIGVMASSAMTALAANAIANDTLEGLPNIGSDVGNFLTNLAPGVGAFIIILGVFGGVASIIYAIVSIVKRKIS